MSDAETRAVSADVVTGVLEADAPAAPAAKMVEREPSVPVDVLMAELDSVPLAVTTALKDVSLRPGR